MDYEKKYKDALEWARKVIHGKAGFVLDEFALDEMVEKFPELAEEAEDEIIRKELIEFIKKRDRCGHDHAYELWLAWLEKQGQTSTKKDIDEVFIERACDAYCNLCDTKECVNIGECDWVGRFRRLLRR